VHRPILSKVPNSLTNWIIYSGPLRNRGGRDECSQWAHAAASITLVNCGLLLTIRHSFKECVPNGNVKGEHFGTCGTLTQTMHLSALLLVAGRSEIGHNSDEFHDNLRVTGRKVGGFFSKARRVLALQPLRV
jgi:hypothetical protein